MSLFSSDPGFSPKHLVENYPWASIGKGTVVDVGGSHGAYSIPIAESFPVTCIIQDRPEVLPHNIDMQTLGLKDRVKFMAHDFFTEQPVKDADVYLFRWIFHDWSDKYSIRILKALIPALKPGARIVVHEYVLPKPGTIPLLQERALRFVFGNAFQLSHGINTMPRLTLLQIFRLGHAGAEQCQRARTGRLDQALCGCRFEIQVCRGQATASISVGYHRGCLANRIGMNR